MDAYLQPAIQPFGDSAILVDWGGGIDPRVNARVHNLARVLMDSTLPGLLECVPAYSSLLVIFDPLVVEFKGLQERIRKIAAALPEQGVRAGRLVEIPVRYGGADGPDLERLAKHCGLSIEETIRLHSEPEYTVFFLGFLPGFPYLGGMHPRLAMPRLEKPRLSVPAGSVGIAGKQTGIYPLESPGGWRIIGRTRVQLFDAGRSRPALISPGDRLKFIPSGSGD